jgi:hypothetical protein
MYYRFTTVLLNYRFFFNQNIVKVSITGYFKDNYTYNIKWWHKNDIIKVFETHCWSIIKKGGLLEPLYILNSLFFHRLPLKKARFINFFYWLLLQLPLKRSGYRFPTPGFRGFYRLLLWLDLKSLGFGS